MVSEAGITGSHPQSTIQKLQASPWNLNPRELLFRPTAELPMNLYLADLDGQRVVVAIRQVKAGDRQNWIEWTHLVATRAPNPKAPLIKCFWYPDGAQDAFVLVYALHDSAKMLTADNEGIIDAPPHELLQALGQWHAQGWIHRGLKEKLLGPQTWFRDHQGIGLLGPLPVVAPHRETLQNLYTQSVNLPSILADLASLLNQCRVIEFEPETPRAIQDAFTLLKNPSETRSLVEQVSEKRWPDQWRHMAKLWAQHAKHSSPLPLEVQMQKVWAQRWASPWGKLEVRNQAFGLGVASLLFIWLGLYGTTQWRWPLPWLASPPSLADGLHPGDGPLAESQRWRQTMAAAAQEGLNPPSQPALAESFASATWMGPSDWQALRKAGQWTPLRLSLSQAIVDAPHTTDTATLLKGWWEARLDEMKAALAHKKAAPPSPWAPKWPSALGMPHRQAEQALKAWEKAGNKSSAEVATKAINTLLQAARKAKALPPGAHPKGASLPPQSLWKPPVAVRP